MSDIHSHVRFYSFISGVLHTQKGDPLCGNCRAFANTALRMKEGIALVEAEQAKELSELTEPFRILLDEARRIIAAIDIPPDAPGQKKAGNCLMPEGVCFVKSSKKLLDTIG
ncbi:MAG: hypothetical protein C0402_12995 [Thermodesulfovibrio sp.]|nr:hypothetical protein [Thermodesulfovibrio sp.]